MGIWSEVDGARNRRRGRSGKEALSWRLGDEGLKFGYGTERILHNKEKKQ